MFIYRYKLYYEDRDWKVANLNQWIVKPSHNIPKILRGGGHVPPVPPCPYTYVDAIPWIVYYLHPLQISGKRKHC